MRRTIARLLLSFAILLLPALPMLGDPAQPAGTCSTNEQCGEKEFCAKLYDRCGQSGKCEERPTDCTERGHLLIRPVCGCDDKSYDNACLAAMAGVSVKREGKCAGGGEDKSGDTLQGIWLPLTAELAGTIFPDEVRKTIKLVIQDDKYKVTVGDVVDQGTAKLNPAATPKEIDITGTEGPNAGRTILAIYEREGDTLRVCYDLSGKGRPTEFKTAEGTQLFLVTYEREKS